MKIASPQSPQRLALVAAAVLTLIASQANAQTIKPYFEFKKPPMITIPGDLSLDTNRASAPLFNAPSSSYLMGFEGVSQYELAAVGRPNFIPPDTIGAVGATQYMETTNGAYAVFDKTTGVRTALVSDVAFWAAAGQTGANGDSRVMYNASANRWVAMSFGANVKDLQIAVSDTSNALGGWKSTKFEGYSGLGFGGTADYPTLAMDTKALYIGTNNFAPARVAGSNSFRGTTLNVIPMSSLFNADAPTVTNMTRFFTPYTGTASDKDFGFAQQGVNSNTPGSSGTVLAVSLFNYDTAAIKVNGVLAGTATGAYLSDPVLIGQAAYVNAGPGRQPSAAIAANRRIIATLDERISSSVYEANGRIYMVQTVNPTGDGLDEARVHYTVLNAATLAILAEGDIGQAGYDYYQGSIAVNSFGEVVIGYNRSGLDAATGKISFMGQSFTTDAGGHLVARSGELLFKESLVDDYHNGSLFGAAAAGRQRWGDYSQVSIDPTDEHKFYAIGEFAREYNNAAGGHPGGSGGSRWGTWIAVVDAAAVPVPEPTTWLMMVFGLGAVAGLARRRAAQGLQG